MCSIIQSLDNGLDNGLEHQTKSGFGLDNGLDNPDQVWIMEWISVCLSKGTTDFPCQRTHMTPKP